MRATVRRRVVAGLLAVQVATVALILLVSGRITADAEAEHTVALLETSASEAIDHTRDYLAPAESLVATSADIVDGGTIDPDALERAFLGELERTAQLAGVYIGGDDGSFFFVTRAGDGYQTKSITISGDVREVTVVDIAADGTRSAPRRLADDAYDPRTRPWFQDASRSASTDVEWTSPYVFFTSGQLGVSASAGVRTADGRLAVVGADIELDSLSTFLAGLRIGPTGGALIVDQNDTVIAHPDATLVRADTGSPMPASQLGDARARSVVGAMISRGSPEPGDDSTVVRYDADGTAGVATSRTLMVGEEAWTIVVHAEDGALVAGLSDARRDERLLMVVVGVLGFVLLAIVAFPATRPLARLERRARIDSLTGLLNRGAILAEGAQIAKDSDLHAAIMIDLDRFKRINDTHGHQVGDEVIHEVATRISGVLRATDRAGRVGGEEFLVVVGETATEEAEDVARRVHLAIGGTAMDTSAGPMTVTASVGLGVAGRPSELQRTLAVADTALLEAKEGGRDRVVSGGMAAREGATAPRVDPAEA